jgi:hypothetical protein
LCADKCNRRWYIHFTFATGICRNHIVPSVKQMTLGNVAVTSVNTTVTLQAHRTVDRRVLLELLQWLLEPQTVFINTISIYVLHNFFNGLCLQLLCKGNRASWYNCCKSIHFVVAVIREPSAVSWVGESAVTYKWKLSKSIQYLEYNGGELLQRLL